MRALALLLLALALPCAAADPARFAAIALHDVVDDERDLDADCITTDRLVGFLEWIRASGIHPITLDDVEAARAGRRPLPERALLLTFDDGFRSLYTRVYPLILAYRVPVVAAVVGEWMDAPMDAEVEYAGRRVPRRKFVSWDEAREMQASGLVEFASHSYALHRRALAPGVDVPADLAKSRELLARELERAPRAFAWPYGRVLALAPGGLASSGFRFALTLDPGLADPAMPLALARHYPKGNPTLAEIVEVLRAKQAP